MIRKFYGNQHKNGFFMLKVYAPDGRFAQDNLVGGITLKTAIFEAKKLNELGMNIDIFPEATPAGEKGEGTESTNQEV